METIEQQGEQTSFQTLVDEVRPGASEPAAPAAAPAPAAAAAPPRRKHRATGNPRGRQPGAVSPKRPSSAAPAAAVVAAETPPMPEVEGRQLRAIFEQLINPALLKLGASPFSAEEVKQGADALAPVANHYAKAKAESLSIWGPMLVFGVTAGAPRIAEVVGNQIRRIRAKRNGSAPAAQTVEVPAASGATFPPVVSEEGLRLGQIVAVKS